MKFNISYKTNVESILSPSELRNSYLFGISLSYNGRTMQDMDISNYIMAAQEQVEKYLDVKIKKQVFEESNSFYRDDFSSWGFIPTSYFVVKPLSVVGFYADVRQLEYPSSWLTSKKTSNDQAFDRNIYLVPSALRAGIAGSAIIFAGITPHLNFLGQSNIPYYWNIKYITGFSRVPRDIMDVVGKLASINALSLVGNLLYGAGVSNVSLGLDGLSQSFGTTKSANSHAFSGLVNQYVKELETTLPRLKDFYKGMALMSC